jgi:hypothetical protein
VSKGFLIFAFNNEVLDYLGHAIWIADRIQRHMNLPTTIVTDTESASKHTTDHNLVFTDVYSTNKRNFKTHDEVVLGTWKNANRFEAYELSPYDETVVIDSDYIVNSDQLATLFETNREFLCYRSVHDLTNTNSWLSHNTFGETQFPHYWATVIYFKKSNFARTVFDLMRMVYNNYTHYANLYKFRADNFRNDYAVSIALSIAYGHRLDSIPCIPWDMPMTTVDNGVEELEQDKFKVIYKKNERYMHTIINNQDIHCLNKFALEELVNG